MPPDPPELFGAAQAAPNFFVLDPSHVRSRLNDMLAAMRAAKRWPWEQVMVELYRETVWPYLYRGSPTRTKPIAGAVRSKPRSPVSTPPRDRRRPPRSCAGQAAVRLARPKLG